MKKHLYKTTIILLICLIVLSGCSVVPSSTPEITSTPEATPTPEPTPDPTPAPPTPTPLMTILNKYKAKSGSSYPWWIDEVPAEQRIKVSILCRGDLIDFSSRQKEVEEAERRGASQKEILKIYDKYTSAPLKEILKRYGLEEQIEDGSLTFYGFTPSVEFVIIDLNILAKLLQDDEVTRVGIVYRELENGEWVLAWSTDFWLN